ncbi:MAG: GNAT family N-acetyltransferase, partial [Halofilum sp. (in: g-proteobacteria)]
MTDTPVNAVAEPEAVADPAPAFARYIEGCGNFTLRRMEPDADGECVHDWVNRPYARYWGLSNTSVEEVRAAYREILAADHSTAWMGFHEGRPAFVLETYRAAGDRIAGYYDVRPGDYGMHILVGPPRQRIPGFTRHVFTVILEFLFSDPAVERIVVEPDVNNEAIHKRNLDAG